MNKSALFKKAHQLTKKILRQGDDYRATFGACLKYLLEEEKSTASEPLTVEKLEKTLAEKVPTASFSAWKDRVYINFSNADYNYRGDRNTKVWYKKTKTCIYFEIQSAKGYRTDEMLDNLNIISKTLISLGFEKNHNYSSFEDGYTYKI